MKLSEFYRVETLMKTAVSLQDKLVGLPNSLGVTITGHYQDEAFVAAVLPSVRAELQRRIKEVREQLVKLGVDVSK